MNKPFWRTPTWLLFTLILLDSALLLALGAMVWFDNTFNRGITYLPNPNQPPIPWTDAWPNVGVNVFNIHMEPDPEAITRTFTLARQLGVRYVRMQMPWDDIEIHGWGDFQDRRHVQEHGVISSWEKYDRIVQTAHRLDITLVVRLDRPPDWARKRSLEKPTFLEGLARDGNSTGPPDDYTDYSSFVSRVADRYRGKVSFFQIWNEPNLKNEWNWDEPSPENFVKLLSFGYEAIKRANPDAIVLFPSLSPVDGLDTRAPMTEMEYLDRVYKAGGKRFFDILSAQSYGLGQPPDEHRYIRLRRPDQWSWRIVDTRTDVSRVVLLREVMERNGDSQKPIWISEMGWNSAPDTIPENRRFTWGQPVREEQKAAYLIGQIERAQHEWPWVGTMFIWNLRFGGFQPPDPADPTPYFSLVQRDWTPLPSYTLLQTYLSQPATAGVGVHRWKHPAVKQNTHGWHIRFRGTTFMLVGNLSGDVQRITLDGNSVFLQSAGITAGGQPLSTIGTLDDRLHEIEIVAPGADPPASFVVGRDPPVPWLWVVGPTVLTIALIISGGATMHVAFITGSNWVYALLKKWRKRKKRYEK